MNPNRASIPFSLFGFFVAMGGLFAIQALEPVRQFFIAPWTAAFAAMSWNLVASLDAGVAVNGAILTSLRNGFAAEITAACNGLDAYTMLASAIAAYSTSWRHRAIGLALGAIAVLILNFVRVVGIFYLGQESMRAYEIAHAYAGPVLFIVGVMAFITTWLYYAPGGSEPQDGTGQNGGAARG